MEIAVRPMRMAQHPNAYAPLGLPELVRKIVEESDAGALAELHDRRRPFRYGKLPSLCMAEFLECLRRKARRNGNEEVADEAYEMTIDKFSRLPANDPHGDDGAHSGRRNHRGVDCRKYFAAFLQRYAEEEGTGRSWRELEKEMLAAGLLQRHVSRHFRLSMAETRRYQHMTRYMWQLPEGSLQVMMPRVLVGGERRDWLNEHIGPVDPCQPAERMRVQALIDEAFANGVSFSYDDDIETPTTTWGGTQSWEGARLRAASEIIEKGLGVAVAAEKAETIDAQRPAVKALGTAALQEMIVQIFSNIADGTYVDGQVASAFRLSPATFSRFAGSRWDRSNGNIPDLWRNTASVLAADPLFMEAAQSAGVWPTVKSIAGNEADRLEESR